MIEPKPLEDLTEEELLDLYADTGYLIGLLGGFVENFPAFRDAFNEKLERSLKTPMLKDDWRKVLQYRKRT